MKTNYLKLVSCGVAILVMSCSTVDPESAETENTLEAVYGKASKGATQISGLGVFADPADCAFEEKGALFALHLTGDLNGCLFVYPETSDCSPSGTYRESGWELFEGTYTDKDGNVKEGSFETSYNFEAKFEGCDGDGNYLGAEIFGRCQHPITKGSGEDGFDGVSGRLDFKDNVEVPEFYYRGHLKL